MKRCATSDSSTIGSPIVTTSNPPREPGTIIELETNDCFTGQIRSEADLVTEIDLSRINSATGPVAVRGNVTIATTRKTTRTTASTVQSVLPPM